MKTLVSALLMIVFCISLTAAENESSCGFLAVQIEESGKIKGQVLDKNTQEPLAGVNITLEGTRLGSATDQNGVFTISNISPGTYSIIIDHIGYRREAFAGIVVVSNQTTDMQTIELVERPIPVSEIVVTPGSYSIMGSEPSARQTLSSEDIKIMGWAEDVTRAIQRVPGISGNDFSAKFNVRGGDVDEVLVLLDGMQIYEPFHQKDFGGGLFSTVDIETIEGLDLLTGGFTAEYGDRMSGILDLKTKRPRENERQTSIGLSVMNMRAFSMGTFSGNRGTWLFSARRGFLDLINKLMNNEFKLEPTYYDLTGKAEYKLSGSQTLSAHAFIANDSYKLDERVVERGKTEPNIDFVDTHYGNNYGWLTLNSIFTPRLFTRTLLYSGLVTKKRYWNQYDDDPEGNFNSATIDDKRDFRLYGVKQDWAYELSRKVFVKFGADLKKLDVEYDYSKNVNNEFIAADETLVDQNEAFAADTSQDGNQVGLYLSGRFRILNPLTLETGLRYDYVSHTKDKLWSPRVGLVYGLSNNTFLRAGWGYYYQSQAIDEMNIQFGEKFYHPAELSEHYVLGLEHLFNNGIQFRAEGYLKKISDLQDSYITFRNIDELFPESRDDLIKLSIDQATTKGIEFFLKYDTGKKISWWLSYVLSDAKDDIEDLQYEGRLVKRTGTLPRFWDQRHTVNLDVNYRPNPKWHFNFAWQYRSGWPHTPFEVKRIARGDGTFAYYHDYGLFNSERYPAYHRLDVRVNRNYYKSNGKITVFLHVINAYNHENINNYDFSILDESAENFVFEINNETWFGILPFVGFSWEF